MLFRRTQPRSEQSHARAVPNISVDGHFDSDLKALASMFRYGKGAYLELAGAIAFILSASASLMVSAKILGRLAERLAQGPLNQESWYYVAPILGFEILNIVLTYNGRVMLAKATNEIMFALRLELFQKISRLPIGYYDLQPLGRILTRLTSDVDGIEKFFSGSLSKVVSAVITIMTVLTAMLLTDLHFGAVIVAASLPAMVFTIVTRTPVRHWLRAYKVRSAELNSKLAEFIAGITIIKVFGLEDWTCKQFEKASQYQLRSGLNLVNWNSFIRPTATLLCSMPLVMIVWWGGHHVLSGTLSIGIVVTFVRYAERFFWPILAVTQEIHVIQEAFTSSERIRQILDEPEEGVQTDLKGLDVPLLGDISFQDVWMGYHPRRPILKGVSFRARAGMKVGLVGATGSGKTTTMSLLPGLYPLLKGSINVDGRPLGEWDLKNIRSQLGMVSQDVIIFRGTLRDNLSIAALPNATLSDEDLMNILGREGFKRIMQRFHHGLQTNLSDGGDNLSMGERQLIAFARMMIRNPKVMILDEATANVDEESERDLHEALHEAMRERTCFVIAHRLATIQAMDHILVFDHGAVVEQGTHDELMKKSGIYTRLVLQQ